MKNFTLRLRNTSLAASIRLKPLALASTLLVGLVTASQAQVAPITENDIQNYAVKMTAAANAKSVSQVSRMVSDDALISVTRKGRVSTLNKASYLNLLQLNWSKTTVYSYQMRVNNVVATGNQAKANIQTIEVLNEGGVMTRLVTDSRATFTKSESGLVLSRAISQLTIEQH